MLAVASIAEEVTWARDWLRGAALPLWAGPGFDAATGTFVERLHLDGRPDEAASRRLIVQCRQVYVYAQAALLGWYPGLPLVRNALTAMRALYHRPDGRPGWVFSTRLDGGVADDRRDAYTHAFVLFALAWCYRSTGDPALIVLADETITDMDRHLSDGVALRTDDRLDTGIRLQNPQMHLFEAYLELAAATKASRFLDRAARLHTLFTAKLLDRGECCLPEVFDSAWRAVAKPSQRWEPGHHFEWIWLLARYGAQAGVVVDAEIDVLLPRAANEGQNAWGGVIDMVAVPSGARSTTMRVWPQCESIKAAAALAERDPATHAIQAARAARSLAVLRNMFLAPALEGGWIDRVDADGRSLSRDIPASTLYHLVFAVAEADRVFGAAALAPKPVSSP